LGQIRGPHNSLGSFRAVHAKEATARFSPPHWPHAIPPAKPEIYGVKFLWNSPPDVESPSKRRPCPSFPLFSYLVEIRRNRWLRRGLLSGVQPFPPKPNFGVEFWQLLQIFLISCPPFPSHIDPFSCVRFFSFWSSVLLALCLYLLTGFTLSPPPK